MSQPIAIQELQLFVQPGTSEKWLAAYEEIWVLHEQLQFTPESFDNDVACAQKIYKILRDRINPELDPQWEEKPVSIKIAKERSQTYRSANLDDILETHTPSRIVIVTTENQAVALTDRIWPRPHFQIDPANIDIEDNTVAIYGTLESLQLALNDLQHMRDEGVVDFSDTTPTFDIPLSRGELSASEEEMVIRLGESIVSLISPESLMLQS